MWGVSAGKQVLSLSTRGAASPTCMALDTEGVQDQVVPIVSKILDTMGTDGDLLGRTAGPGSRRDPEGPWTRRGVPAGDYMPRPSCVGSHTFFFWAKTDMPPK